MPQRGKEQEEQPKVSHCNPILALSSWSWRVGPPVPRRMACTRVCVAAAKKNLGSERPRRGGRARLSQGSISALIDCATTTSFLILIDCLVILVTSSSLLISPDPHRRRSPAEQSTANVARRHDTELALAYTQGHTAPATPTPTAITAAHDEHEHGHGRGAAAAPAAAPPPRGRSTASDAAAPAAASSPRTHASTATSSPATHACSTRTSSLPLPFTLESTQPEPE